ncbi:MAG: hypothetical protein RLY16_2180, partial [Bacteroidota bacterium]
MIFKLKHLLLKTHPTKLFSTLRIFIFTTSFTAIQNIQAQTTLANEAIPNKITLKELSIPSSPLFDLMGASPSLVAKSSDIKDFKVDWSFRSWRLNPNLAIQSQPIWELFYNRKNLNKYQQASKFARMLASTDLSVGTIQNESNDRRIGGALKINLYKQKDPLLEKDQYNEIQQQFAEEFSRLQSNERDILKQLDTTFKPSEMNRLRSLLKENDIQLSTYYSRRNNAIQEKAKEIMADSWNASFVDFAFGKVFTYSTDSIGALSKLKLNRNTGNGAWINFGFGVGKRGMITGLIRSTFYEELVNFTLRDQQTGDLTNEEAIASNKIITLGINFRYGGPVYNFFAEFVREGKTTKTPFDALSSAFTTPTGKEIVAQSVKWDIV